MYCLKLMKSGSISPYSYIAVAEQWEQILSRTLQQCRETQVQEVQKAFIL